MNTPIDYRLRDSLLLRQRFSTDLTDANAPSERESPLRKSTNVPAALTAHKDYVYPAADGPALQLTRIDGLSRCWDEQNVWQLHRRIESAVSGYCSEGARFIFLIASNGSQTGFFLGSPNDGEAQALEGVLAGSLQDVSYTHAAYDIRDVMYMVCRGAEATEQQAGLVLGMPATPSNQEAYLSPAYTLVSGMQGARYCVAFVCKAVEAPVVNDELTMLFNEKDQATRDLQYTTGASIGGETLTRINTACKQYLADLELYENHLITSRNLGAWEMTGYYLADCPQTAIRLTSLLRTAYNGDTAGPDVVRCIPYPRAVKHLIECTVLPSCARRCAHPLNPDGRATAFSNPFRVQLSSRQLASYLMLPDRETSGFFVNEPSRFDLASRIDDDASSITLGSVMLSAHNNQAVGEYHFPSADLSRHALVAGATGGGKSNTIRSILSTLHNQKNVPFMVIESAKSEYWQLIGYEGFSDLCVMSLGETTSPFRLNPFECTAGFSLQTHVDSLLSTFKAAFEMYAPMPFVLEQSVYEVYRDYGWDIATGANKRARKQYPTLSDLYWQIPETVSTMAYDKEIKDNVTGALQTRVRSLMVGGKGVMMNCRESTPLTRLLRLPTVLELENLGDDETKAFVMGLLMNRLYEYRRVESGGGSRSFMHLLIIEEAHRLLKNVPPTEGSSRAASVEFFCNMLSEIRSYGQGMLIADQSPVKLAPDSLRNTNLKIVHRMVDRDDRAAVGGAMHMNEEQQEAVTMLTRGVAAVYAEGDNRPKLVRFPLVSPTKPIDRAAVLSNAPALLGGVTAQARGGYHSGCAVCPQFINGRCNHDQLRQTAAGMSRLNMFDYPDDQRKDFEQRYEESGPAAMLTDAIVRLTLEKEMANRGMSEDERTAQSAHANGQLRICMAGYITVRMHFDDPQMPALILDRYSNLLLKNGQL